MRRLTSIKKRRALEVFMTGVTIFDALGYQLNHLPVWQFLPLWVGMIAEIEVGARALSWLSSRLHLQRHSPGSRGL